MAARTNKTARTRDQKGPGDASKKNRKGTTLIRASVIVLGRLNISRLLFMRKRPVLHGEFVPKALSLFGNFLPVFKKRCNTFVGKRMMSQLCNNFKGDRRNICAH